MPCELGCAPSIVSKPNPCADKHSVPWRRFPQWFFPTSPLPSRKHPYGNIPYLIYTSTCVEEPKHSLHTLPTKILIAYNPASQSELPPGCASSRSHPYVRQNDASNPKPLRLPSSILRGANKSHLYNKERGHRTHRHVARK